MGFLDKAKEAAAQAAQKAQQGMAQGQAKVGELQTKRQADALLRDLGAAYYAQQRSGGLSSDVAAAMAAIDAHVAASGPLDAGPPEGQPPSGTATGSPPPPQPTAGQPTPPAQAGGYGLDDL